MHRLAASALVLLGACGSRPDQTAAVSQVACERLEAQRTVELLREDVAGRTWSLTLAQPATVRAESSLGTLTAPPGWVVRAAWVLSPDTPTSPVRVRIDAIDARGRVDLEFAPPPSVDPSPKAASADVVLSFEPNSVGPSAFTWKTGPLPIAPCR